MAKSKAKHYQHHQIHNHAASKGSPNGKSKQEESDSRPTSKRSDVPSESSFITAVSENPDASSFSPRGFTREIESIRSLLQRVPQHGKAVKDGGYLDEREEELARTRQELAEAAEAAAQRYDALLSEKQRLEGMLLAYQDELQRAGGEREALEVSLRDMQAGLTNLTSQFEQLRNDLQSKRRRLDALQAEKEEVEVERDDAYARIAYFETYKKEMEASQKRNGAANGAVAPTVTSDSEAVASLRRQLETLAHDLKTSNATISDRDQELERLKASMLKDVTTLQRSFDEQTQQAAENHGKVVDELRDSRKALHAAEEAHEKAITAVKMESSQRLQQLEDSGRQERARLETEHKNTMEAERARNREAVAKLQVAAQTQLARLQEQHARDRNENNAAHAAAIAAAHSEYTTKQDDLQNEHDRELKESEERLSDITNKLAEADERYRVLLVSQQTANESHARDLTNTQKDHEQHLSDLKAQHEEEMKGLHDLHDEALKVADQRYMSLKISHKDSLNDLRTRHDEHVSNLRAQHQSQLELETEKALRELSEAVAAHEASFASLQDEHDARINSLTSALQQSKAELAALKRSSAADKDQAEQMWSVKLNDLRSSHVLELQRLTSQNEESGEASAKISAEMAAMRKELEESRQRLQSVQAEHDKQLTDLKQNLQSSAHGQQKELEELHESKRKELKQMEALIQQSLEEEMKSVNTAHQKQIQKTQTSHQAQLEALKRNHEQTLASVKQENSKALAEREAHWEKRLKSLKSDHKRSLSSASQANDSSTSAQISELQQQHADALAAARAEHRAALDAAVERTRQLGEADVRKLKRRHQDAIAEVRVRLQKQQQETEQKHRDALESTSRGFELAISAHEAERKASIETHQGDLMRLENEHVVRLKEVERKYAAEKAELLETREKTFRAELQAVQDRLDATLTSRAEAERAVAVVRKQSSEAEKRIADVKSSMEEQLKTLREEKVELAAQLRLAQAALKQLESKMIQGDDEGDIPAAKKLLKDLPSPPVLSPASVSRRSSLHQSEFTITRLEQELSAAQNLAQRRLDEKSEMVRQNDFLIKELEVLLAQRSHAKTSSAKVVDALVQTEPFISEQKTSQEAMRSIKAELQSRPKTPLSPAKEEAQAEIDNAWHGRSFEGHLRHAQAELNRVSEATVLANEALFAEKIEEHAGELQRSKDLLTLEYKALFERLADEAERMEKLVKVQQQAAFAEERHRLLASYGADFDDREAESAAIANLPEHQSLALRAAEQKLVSDYNDRLARRKSEIALKHAEEFHSLTREYDRSMAELLNGKRRVISYSEPSAFEFELVELNARSMQSGGSKRNSFRGSSVTSPSNNRLSQTYDEESAREGRSQTPRSDISKWTAAPRTASSLPRSTTPGGKRRSLIAGAGSGTPQPSNNTPQRNSPAPSSLPRPVRQQVQENQHTHHRPIAQHSLIRGKTPTDVLPLPPPTPTSSGSPLVRPKTPNNGGAGTLVMKSPGGGPVIPERRSLGVGLIPKQHLQELRLLATPGEYERQQATTIAAARQRMSLDSNAVQARNNALQRNGRGDMSSPPPPPVPAKSLPPRTSSIPVPTSSLPQYGSSGRTTSPTDGAANYTTSKSLTGDALAPSSPQDSTSSKRSSIFNIRRKSKRLSSGLIYWKPPKHQAFDVVG